jgi:hypothetical protein
MIEKNAQSLRVYQDRNLLHAVIKYKPDMYSMPQYDKNEHGFWHGTGPFSVNMRLKLSMRVLLGNTLMAAAITVHGSYNSIRKMDSKLLS